MKFFSDPLIKRKLVCVVLGIAFGFVCLFLANSNQPEGSSLWGTPVMWNILFNRLLIGVVIFIAGVYTKCKFTGLKFYPWLRGFFLGAFVSLDLAIGTLMMPESEQAWMIFWSTIIAGGIYGVVIDVAATKIGGEGKQLIE